MCCAPNLLPVPSYPWIWLVFYIYHLWGRLSHRAHHHVSWVRGSSVCTRLLQVLQRQCNIVKYRSCGDCNPLEQLTLHVRVVRGELRHEARPWLCCLYFGKMACVRWSDPAKEAFWVQTVLRYSLQAWSGHVNQSETVEVCLRLGVHNTTVRPDPKHVERTTTPLRGLAMEQGLTFAST